MPPRNRFRPQEPLCHHLTSLRIQRLEDPIYPSSDRLSLRDWQRIRSQFAKAHVDRIMLLHGTFVGNDSFGWVRDVGRFVPRATHVLRRLQKRVIDHWIGDKGNYSQQFRDALALALHSPECSPKEVSQSSRGSQSDRCENDRRRSDEIFVERWHWSGENHEIGRCDAAIRLIHDLFDRLSNNDRIMIWAHSHGGNVLALVSNLLAAESSEIDKFFHLTQAYWKLPGTERLDLPVWKEVREILREEDRQQLASRIDVVTYGTPVLYGWDTNGLNRLVHFIHVRQQLPSADGSEPASILSSPTEDLFRGRCGDMIQLLGVAGTSVSPTWIQWRARRADRQLRRWLLPNFSRRNLWKRWNEGRRMHADGYNVLVDYRNGENDESPMAGHAVYTQTDYIHFHLVELAKLMSQEPQHAQDDRSHHDI